MASVNNLRLAILILWCPYLISRPVAHGRSPWRFTDVTESAGLTHLHGHVSAPRTTPMERVSGGVAAGDFDRDGYVDLYLIGGDAGVNRLFRNLGDGSFEDVAARAGVALESFSGSGPLFFDYDGDGWLDLLVGAIGKDRPRLFRSSRDGTFADATDEAGLAALAETISVSAGDYDGDGWLDLFAAHWGTASFGLCHLWRNAGGRFVCADLEAGLAFSSPIDHTFTGNFADLDSDGDLDLLVTSDFGTSRVWRNEGGVFADATSSVITDENGMGSALGDYDGDGDLDWFVSSVWDSDGVTEGDWGTSGNRLYRNTGDGFEDATDDAGVREGDWGWGASFCDVDNDGRLDLVHVNGWPQGSAQFRGTAARLFLGSAFGRMQESAVERGLDDRAGGRGVVCFDYDRDGDLDLFIANSEGPGHLWRNDGDPNSLSVSLSWRAPNVSAVGAQITVESGGLRQLRVIRAGSNYVSQDPEEAHFGLGDASSIDRVSVVWPDGSTTTQRDLKAGKIVISSEPAVGCSG